MRKLILLCLLIPLNIFAQTIWTQYNTSQIQSDIYFVNPLTGWSVGYNGSIFKSVNGGINWNPQTSGVTANLFSVYFANENTGWIGGFTQNTPLRTIDGGNTWIPSGLGFSGYIFDMSFVDESTGWLATGGGGTGPGYVYKTVNGGINWFLQLSTTDLRSIHFLDQNTGWICGANGMIHRTNDGGVSWIIQPSGITTRLEDIQFINYNTGWSVGLTGTILKTTNGGSDWFAQNSETSNPLWGCFFNDAQNGRVVGSTGTIKRTGNGGISWVVETAPSTSFSFYDIFFITNDIGFIAGGSSYGVILKTSNGGGITQTAPSTPSSLEAVANSVRAINISWSDNSNNEDGFKIERSTDEGNTWSLLYTAAPNTVSYSDPDLTPYSPYYYRVYAYNQFGNSQYSNTAWDIAMSYNSCENIFVLITKINELKSAEVINQGQANSLIVKLNLACNKSGSGQFGAAIEQMYAFINQVNAFISGNILTLEQGQPLINIANDIIILLQGGTSPLKTGNNSGDIPKFYSLSQNYPNPFNPKTIIKYQLPANNYVTLKIYDMTGKEMAVLVNDIQNPGKYEAEFDGSSFASGIYFYSLIAGDFKETKKMILIK